MADYKKEIKEIYDYIKRSEDEQLNPFAYEISLLSGGEERAFISRTSGTSKLNEDLENAVQKAFQSHGKVKVQVYGGKSHNARRLDTFTIDTSPVLTSQNLPGKQEIKDMIKAEIQQIPQSHDVLDNLNSLLGSVTGSEDDKLKGLFGLFNTISGHNKEIDRITYQKQLDDFKFETRFNNLHERYERLLAENEGLKAEKEQFSNENRELKSQKEELENRLSKYTPHEILSRVGIGAIANIGSRILSNSPKTAEIMGLTPEELKGALGMVEQNTAQADESSHETNNKVEITELGAEQSPEQQKKNEIIKNISDALITWELEEVTKIANIVGLCLDREELINKTLAFLSQAIQDNTPTTETENS